MEQQDSKRTGILISLGFHSIFIFLLFILPGFKFYNNDKTGINDLNLISQAGGGEQDKLEISLANSDFNNVSLNSYDVPDEGQVQLPRHATKLKFTVTEPKQRSAEQKSLFQSRGHGTGKTIGEGPGTEGLEPIDKEGKESIYKPIRRNQISYPDFDNDFVEEGSLVFIIAIDRQGNIKRIKKTNPSTVSNVDQINKAQKLILTYAKFAPNPRAEEEQIGYYSIVFKKR
jgi:hypothetical protein